MSAKHHRAPDPAVAPSIEVRFITTNLRILIVLNVMVGAGLTAVPAGRSPALGLLASLTPLPVWGLVGFGGVAALLLAKSYVWGHRLAVMLWCILAGALVTGVATGASNSPAASLIFAGLAVGLLALHLNGLRYRRAWRAAQRTQPNVDGQ